jgi:hypothetical protein
VHGYEAKHVVAGGIGFCLRRFDYELPGNSSIAKDGIPHAGEFAPKGTDDTEAVGMQEAFTVSCGISAKTGRSLSYMMGRPMPMATFTWGPR